MSDSEARDVASDDSNGHTRAPTVDCVGNPAASTVPLTKYVAICPAFRQLDQGMGSVILIHEMMHTLGYGEGPKYPGFPASSQITQDVITACGR